MRQRGLAAVRVIVLMRENVRSLLFATIYSTHLHIDIRLNKAVDSFTV